MNELEKSTVVTEQSEPTSAPVVSEPATTVEKLESPPDEKSLLLARARLMGLKVSNNISVEKLKAKIEEHMQAEQKMIDQGTTGELEEEPVPAPMTKNAAPKGPETRQQIRDRLVREKMKLVRLRITNLDPKKKGIHGEIITVANKYIGTVRKYIPFGEATENGYHVPYCIYEMLKSRKFLHIRVIKARNGKGERVETSYVPEFSLEVLPQLTPKELKELARMQAAKAGATSSDEG